MKPTCLSGRVSPRQRIPPPLRSANVSPCTPVKTDAWLLGGAGGVVNVPWSWVGSENFLTPCRSEGLQCRAISVGSVGADQSSAGERRLPSASAGAAASAAQETASALMFKANTGFCFQKQITLSQGNSVSHSYLNQTGSLWFFYFDIKMSILAVFLDALVKSTSLIFFLKEILH